MKYLLLMLLTCSLTFAAEVAPKQALNNLSAAVQGVRATAQEHEILRQSLLSIKKLIDAKDKKKEAKEAK